MNESQISEILAEVSFYSTDKGGRTGRLPLSEFRCPMVLNDEMFDCLLRFSKDQIVNPGDTVRASMYFLSPDKVLPTLQVETTFHLWERGVIASGEIIEIRVK